MKTFTKLWAGSLGVLVSVNFVSAQTWDGGANGGNANWGTAANWSPDGVPTATGTANILFSGATKPNVNVNVAANVNSITFNPGVSYTLSGGSLTLQSGGIINSALNNAINVGTLSLGASQSWQANGGNLSFAGTTLNLNGNALTLSGNNDFSIANAIGDGTGVGGSITKTGSGTLSMTGASTYTGATTISAGTLNVNNTTGSATGSGTVTLGGGTRLTGGGTISGPVTLQSGSALAAGNNGTGTITTGGLTLDGNNVLEIEVNQAGGTAGGATGWDKIVAPTLTLNASAANPIVIDLRSLTLGNSAGAVADFDNNQAYSWLIAETTGGIFNFSESAFDIQLGNFANDTGLGDFNVFSDGNNLYLNFTPVPEPSTVAFGAMGGALLLASMMRRKKK